MVRLAPMSLRLIQPDWVHRVPAPAHDSLTANERQRYVAENPHTYLAVTRSPEDLAPGEQWDPEVALARSRAALDRLLEAGAFGQPAPPCFYLYRLTLADHEQVGIVGGVATDDYDQGVVRVHEHIRPSRAEHLAEQLGGLGVQSSPIAVAYRPDPVLAEVIETGMAAAAPAVEISSTDGIGQQVWAITSKEAGRTIQQRLAEHPLYLIDGHHRAAAASSLRQKAPGGGAEWMLAAAFPAQDLRNAAFHRCLPGVDPRRLLDILRERLPVRPADLDEVLARRPCELALLLPRGGEGPQWYLVTLPEPAPHDERAPADELLAGLEPVRLEREVLIPVLGIDQGAADDRIAFRHGPGDRDDLDRLASEATAPTWIMRPVSVESLIRVSDAGAVLPPKSTYFQPKVRSGVFLRSLR